MLSKLDFTPNSLCYLPIGQNDTLIAAGGQEAEIHLSYHTASGSSSSRRTRLAWEYSSRLLGSINNSVLLTSMSLTRSNESSIEPRVGVSNNDCSIRFYDIPLHVPSPRRTLQEVGQVRLDVPINHSSISPDGRTLLSVGDANKIFFHGISGGARLTFTPINTLTIPPPDPSGTSYSSASLTAAFSTAFSGDGSKFAVASQEGVIAVWDVRSTKPLKVFQTDKTRIASGRTGNGGASNWLSDDPWEWTRGTKAPGWCARSVKFNGGEGARLGKEVMAFTEV
jgi:WD40 repeat protein